MKNSIQKTLHSHMDGGAFSFFCAIYSEIQIIRSGKSNKFVRLFFIFRQWPRKATIRQIDIQIELQNYLIFLYNMSVTLIVQPFSKKRRK
jgi:hypothetical protein